MKNAPTAAPLHLSRPAAPLAALLAALLAGCVHAAPGAPGSPGAIAAGGALPAAEPAPTTGVAPATTAAAHPAATGVLEATRAVVAALLETQGEVVWHGWTTGAPIDLGPSWAGREALASPATLAELADAREQVPAAERPGLERLRAFLLGEHLARQTAGPSQALASARAAATFTFDKRAVPLRQLDELLAGEAAAPRRQALQAAHDAAAAKLAPRAAARDAALAEAGRALGFDSTLGLAAQLRGEEPTALAALAEATLTTTEATWHALLEALARKELQMPLSRVRERDLPRLLRITAPAAAFPADRLVSVGEAVLAGLGLDQAAGGHLTLDAAPRPGKLRRPLAVAVAPPATVRLSFTPAAGLEPARAFLSELGVAQAAARVDPAASVEDRLLPAVPLTEAWGRLLGAVTGSPEWLHDHGVSDEPLRREVRLAAGRRLREARLAAGRVLGELERARDPARAAARWPALWARATGHPVDKGEVPPWLADPDPLLRAGDTLRAALLAAQAELALSADAGGPWWRSARSGARLVGLWSQGGRLTPEGAARALGTAGLDPAALDALVRARAAAGGIELPPGPASPAVPPTPTEPAAAATPPASTTAPEPAQPEPAAAGPTPK